MPATGAASEVAGNAARASFAFGAQVARFVANPDKWLLFSIVHGLRYSEIDNVGVADNPLETRSGARSLETGGDTPHHYRLWAMKYE